MKSCCDHDAISSGHLGKGGSDLNYISQMQDRAVCAMNCPEEFVSAGTFPGTSIT